MEQPEYTIAEAKRILATASEMMDMCGPEGVHKLKAPDIIALVCEAAEVDARLYGQPGSVLPRGILSVQP